MNTLDHLSAITEELETLRYTANTLLDVGLDRAGGNIFLCINSIAKLLDKIHEEYNKVIDDRLKDAEEANRAMMRLAINLFGKTDD